MGSGPVAGAAQDTSPRAPPRGRRPRPSVLLRAPPCSSMLSRSAEGVGTRAALLVWHPRDYLLVCFSSSETLLPGSSEFL